MLGLIAKQSLVRPIAPFPDYTHTSRMRRLDFYFLGPQVILLRTPVTPIVKQLF